MAVTVRVGATSLPILSSLYSLLRSPNCQTRPSRRRRAPRLPRIKTLATCSPLAARSAGDGVRRARNSGTCVPRGAPRDARAHLSAACSADLSSWPHAGCCSSLGACRLGRFPQGFFAQGTWIGWVGCVLRQKLLLILGVLVRESRGWVCVVGTVDHSSERQNI